MGKTRNFYAFLDRNLVHVARGAWIVLAVTLCIKAAVAPMNHSVFPVFVDGGHDWLAGESMYRGGFYYGPAYALAMAPFAMLPYSVSEALWGVLGIACLVHALHVFWRDVLPQTWPASAKHVISLLTFAGSLRSIWCGQNNGLIIAAALLGAAAVVKQRWWRAAFLFAAPIHIKVWPAVVAALFAVEWPRKLMVRLTIATAAIGLIPFAFASSTIVAGYYSQWYERLAQRQAGGARWDGYRDAWTIWEQFAPVNKTGFLALQASAGLAVLAWCLWQQRRKLPTAQLAACTVAIWASWQLLFGPGSERPTYIILAPMTAWAVVKAFMDGRGRTLAIAATAMTSLLGAGGIERLFLNVTPTALAMQPLGVVVFIAWLVAYGTFPDAGEVPQASTDRHSPQQSGVLKPAA